jgi:hypothetical protein
MQRVGALIIVAASIHYHKERKTRLTRKRLIKEQVDLSAQFGRINTLHLMCLRKRVSYCKNLISSPPTLFPSKNKINVGVTLTPYSPPTALLIPTLKSILTNATSLARLLLFASSSNTGSIILQGPHVALVKNATTARCVRSTLWKDEGFVAMCTGVVRLLPWTGVGGDVGAGVGR